jgi:hypothetical protein
MGVGARIDIGHVVIDTAAWLEQRTAGVLDEPTRDLHAWAAAHADTPRPPGVDPWRHLTLTWCRHHRLTGPGPVDAPPGPDLVHHEFTRLDTELWVARAVSPTWGRLAVVQQDDDPPTVYADDTRETAPWLDADTVTIACPHGHGWTWPDGEDLADADDRPTTLAAVFGPSRDAPFTCCPHCTAHTHGRRPEPCRCDRTSWIVCPICGARCDTHLPTL